jgi:glycosyltransferase involved in cell wall biosynthesis
MPMEPPGTPPPPLRILLVTPAYLPETRGNAVTVHRIAQGLARRGHRVEVRTVADLVRAGLAGSGPGGPAGGLRPPSGWPDSDVVHAFHALAGVAVCRARIEAGRTPLVVTLTGTDVNVDLADAARRGRVLEYLSLAQRIVTFHESMIAPLAAAAPEIAARARVVPQAPHLPGGRLDFRRRHHVPRKAVLFVLPGGIRPVKASHWPLAPFARLRARHRRLRLVLVGPSLDPAYAAEVERRVRATGGAAFAGDVPHDRMRAVLAAADLVLNVSESEGGMSNAVLEAHSVGVPTLVRRIAGNLSLVTEGVTGLTFATEAEFEAQVERYLDDPAAVRRMAQRARREVAARYSRVAEIRALEGVYGEAMAEKPAGARRF